MNLLLVFTNAPNDFMCMLAPNFVINKKRNKWNSYICIFGL